MFRTCVILPNGTELFSGPGTVNAIAASTLTECVNSGTELTPGSVCASMLELKLITPGGGLPIAAGQELTVYQVSDDDMRQQVGIFIAEKPTRPSMNTMTVTAYDRISLLDRDLTDWLAARTDWPCTLYELAREVCAQCGLELADGAIPGGSLLVEAFTAREVTGRRLLQWIGQVANRFCRATADGKVEFAWYTPVPGHSIGPAAITGRSLAVTWASDTLWLTEQGMIQTALSGTVTVTAQTLTATRDGAGCLTITPADSIRQHFFYRGSLSFADQAVAPVEKVQLQAQAEDVGVIWPDDTRPCNTYRITGNPLLVTLDTPARKTLAQALYTQMSQAVYTPCRVTIPANSHIRAGHILTVTDATGRAVIMWVMSRRRAGQRDTLECTGSHRRDSVSAVNEQSYQALSGKVLTLQTDVDGIRAANRDAQGRLASLDVSVEGLTAKVEQQSTQTQALQTGLTTLEQTADAIRLEVRTIRQEGATKVRTGASYTFDDNGLRIAREGQSMENRLDNTGMYVSRAGQTILRANDDGVAATDVQVNNYLCIGANARLEDFEGSRMACFYTGQ